MSSQMGFESQLPTEAERASALHKAEELVAEDKQHHTRYGIVAVWLFIITAVEVAIVFLPVATWVIVVGLFVLMAMKAIGVAGYYMHLKDDARSFSYLFGAGLLVALVLIFAFAVLYLVFTGGATELFVKDSGGSH